jgi:hypothetical protein
MATSNPREEPEVLTRNQMKSLRQSVAVHLKNIRNDLDAAYKNSIRLDHATGLVGATIVREKVEALKDGLDEVLELL